MFPQIRFMTVKVRILSDDILTDNISFSAIYVHFQKLIIIASCKGNNINKKILKISAG